MRRGTPYRSLAMTNGRSVDYGFDRFERGTRGTVGRKTRLTPDLKAGIVSSVRKGLSNQAACRVVGISEMAFYNWLKRGATSKCGKFMQFVQSLKRARGGFQGLEPRRHPTGRWTCLGMGVVNAPPFGRGGLLV